MYDTLTIQKALRARGFTGAYGRPLTLDGVKGRNTSHAIRAFKRSAGLRDRDYIGPLTFALLTGEVGPEELTVPKNVDAPPWYIEMMTMMGKHESGDYTAVREWLDEDGVKLGDQRRIPWCGAAVDSALNNSGFTEDHPKKPNAAISWLKYGIRTTPRVGAIMVQHRGNPSDWRGHIGFYAGESATHYYLLGGNQGDSVNITPFRKGLLREGGCRWPPDGPDPRGWGKIAMSGGKETTVT